MHHKCLDLKIFCWCNFLKHHSNHIYLQIHLMLDFNYDWTPSLSYRDFFIQFCRVQPLLEFISIIIYPISTARTILQKTSDMYIVVVINILDVALILTNYFIHIYNIHLRFIFGRSSYKNLTNFLQFTIHLQVWFHWWISWTCILRMKILLLYDLFLRFNSVIDWNRLTK